MRSPGGTFARRAGQNLVRCIITRSFALIKRLGDFCAWFRFTGPAALERGPEAFIGLFHGENVGERLAPVSASRRTGPMEISSRRLDGKIFLAPNRRKARNGQRELSASRRASRRVPGADDATRSCTE